MPLLLLLLLTALTLLCAGVALSLWWSIALYTPVALRVPHPLPLKVCVVLGSGGHTSEMLRLIRALPANYWAANKPFFVVSASDTHSASVAQEQELRCYGREAAIRVIPRAREVGQSYFSSVATTLRAIAVALRVMAEERPDVVLTNGPGVCVPVVVASMLLAGLLPWRFHRPATAFVESFTCVHRLSLTGRLLAPFAADTFAVYWRSLLPVVRALRRRRGGGGGGLFYLGCDEDEEAHGVDRGEPSEGGGRGEDESGADDAVALPAEAVTAGAQDVPMPKLAVVTVGSTRFDKLVDAVARESVCETLRTELGITRVLLQYGTGSFPLSITTTTTTTTAAAVDNADEVQVGVCGGVTIEAFRYRSGLDRWVRRADVVITHAGAGTILECLHARVPTVVVPNRDLMSDHQLELAEALAERGFLLYVAAEDVEGALRALKGRRLRPFNGISAAALGRAMAVLLTGKHEDE